MPKRSHRRQAARKQRRRESPNHGHTTAPGERPSGTGYRAEPGRPPDLAAAVRLARQAIFGAADMLVTGDPPRASDSRRLADLVSMLDEGPPMTDGKALVDRELAACLDEAIGAAWANGWQPADVVRVAERINVVHRRFAIDMVAVDAGRFADAAMDSRWIAQLRQLDAAVWWDATSASHLDQWTAREGLPRVEGILCGVRLLSVLLHLPVLPKLIDLPGERRTARPSPGLSAQPSRGGDPRMLDKVRALLAKAESTTFPEEAESLTAKAQELIARYSIDRAMLDRALADSAPGGGGQGAAGVRLGVDDPYAGAKAILLSEVAVANSCKTVWSKEFGFSTVFGFESDLDAVEILYTSLLVQATAAMVAAGSQIDRYGRSRTRSFRQSFLVAYARRIGERLRQAQESSREQAVEEYGGALLPVLADRSQVVEDALKAAFEGKLKRMTTSVSNHAGSVAGWAAAERAWLSAHPEVAGPQ